MTHTPGPWAAERGTNLIVYVAAGAYPYGQSICEVESSNKDADARLIAAAPAMLDALKVADQRIAQLCAMVCHLGSNPKKARAEDFADEVRAAIALAEGK